MNNTGIIIRKIYYYNMLHMAENGMSERIFVVAKKKGFYSMNNTGIMIHKIIYYNMVGVVENGMPERSFVIAKKKNVVTV